MVETWNWRTAARCQVGDAEGLFVRGRHQQEARRFCGVCPVRTECLAHALDNRVERGVWGGMTERQRRALLRERPRVRSWAELLCAARRAYYGDIAARLAPPADAGVGSGGERPSRAGTAVSGRHRDGSDAEHPERGHGDAAHPELPRRDRTDGDAGPATSPADTDDLADVTPSGQSADDLADVTPTSRVADGSEHPPQRRCNDGGRTRRAGGAGATARRGGCPRHR